MVMVSVGTSSDSAVEETDYAVVDDFEIVIPAGDVSVTGTFTLAPVDDAFAEGEETLTVSGLSSGVTVTVTELTITDDDTESTALVLTISPDSGVEDAGTVDVGVTVRLDAGARTLPTNVTLTVLDGTATSLGDYSVSSSPVTLQIPMGMTEVTGTVPIAIVNDDIAEGDETVTLRVEATGLTSDSKDFTIEDDDTSLSITLGVSPSSLAKDVSTAAPVVTVTATMDGDTFTDPQTVMVSVGTSSGSAVGGTDYEVVDDFAIVIPAGDASATGTFTLAPMDDAFAEGEETVTVSGLLSGVTVTATELTITDDDTAGTDLVLTIVSAVSAHLHEDSGTSWVRFRASLNNAAAPMDTPVDVSVTDGTATAGADYSISAIPSSIIIPAGEKSIGDSLQITITDDDAVEGNETIVIGVSAQDLTGTTQDLVIIDDEAAVRIDVINVIAQDDGSYTVTAAVRQNIGAPVTSVVLYYGDGITFEMAPMQSLGSLYTAELMAPDEGGILYYYVVATNGDGLTATYPPDGRYWDISNYTDDSRLVLLDFENGDAGDKSTVRHYVAYKGGAGALAEGVLALDGLEDYTEILGSDLGARYCQWCPVYRKFFNQ